MRFEGKSIIVTGAGSGIGRAAALLFAEEGGSVVVADVAESVEETAQAIVKAGGVAMAIRMDAGSEEDVVRTVSLACTSFGGLDIMFANAGISGGMANIFETDVSMITEVLRVNLIGPLSRDQAFSSTNRGAGGEQRSWRRDRADCKRGRHSLRCRRGRLLSVQSGSDKLGNDRSTAVVRLKCARKRYLPRPDRNGDDQAYLRLCA